MLSRNRSKQTPLRFAISFAIFSLILALVGAILIFISVFCFKNIKEKPAILDADAITLLPTVIIDAGHGGEDGGASGKGGSLEKELNLDIAAKIADMLRSSGIKVIMTRTEDILLYDRNADYMGHKKSLDLRARLDIAKSNPNSVFVSIHMNAFGDARYKGLQVWYSKNTEGSRRLADTVQNLVRETLQNDNNRKTKEANSSIYLLDRAVCDSILIECGFLSNSEEEALLLDENYRKTLALTLFAAIKDYLSAEYSSAL
ncbi:MAG: N-acetylmuramoyl-L-alanine amidase [Clostridia bacterium]|nr:N-acetylmuramoyl-L-alanine amidase [Clostridia bacterium]